MTLCTDCDTPLHRHLPVRRTPEGDWLCVDCDTARRKTPAPQPRSIEIPERKPAANSLWNWLRRYTG